MGCQKRHITINPCEIHENFHRKPNAMHRPVIHQSVTPLHRTAAYPTVPHDLTQNDEADMVLLCTGHHGRNLSGFVAWQIFHLPAHQHHRYETTLHEIMEVKIDEIQSEK